MKLFPDEVLPVSVDTAYDKLSSGATPILRLNGDPDRVWILGPKGRTKAEKPESYEQQVASFMQGIAQAIYDKLDKEDKPEIFRAWTGRF